MKIKKHIIKTAMEKAAQSPCAYRISAIGVSRRGEIIDKTFNLHRFGKKGGGIHAEMALMKRHPKALKTIIICRIGKDGCLLPIEPCDICKKKANELDIKICTVKE